MQTSTEQNRHCTRAVRRLAALAAPVMVGMLATGGAATLWAKDWPQWRGTERLGLWTETGVLDEFPDGGLTVNWRVPVNVGYSGPAVADGRVFVLDYVETEPRTMDGTERLLALDEERGGPRNWDSLLRWDPDQGEGVWNATEETELSC